MWHHLAMKPHRLSLALAASLSLLAWPAIASAAPGAPDQDPYPSVGLVAHQHAEVGPFRFQDGQVLPLRVGFESYGQPNATKSNAILVCHFFGGTGHAAGKLSPSDPRPGYWEALIGPGKAIDTNRHWVIAADVPANVNRRPWLQGSGPLSLNPATQKPYGASFPAVSVADMVQSQAALAKHLGIARWQAVVGASLGGMQALRWAVDRPDMVAKVVAIAAPGRTDPYGQVIAQLQVDAIRNDPAYPNGTPLKGLGQAWTLLMLQGLDRQVMTHSGSVAPGFGPELLRELQSQAPQRAATLDHEAWLRLAAAARDHDLGAGHGGYAAALRRVKAKALVLAAEGDLLFPPEALEADLVAPLRAAGASVRLGRFRSGHGHLGLLFDASSYAQPLQAFLAQP